MRSYCFVEAFELKQPEHCLRSSFLIIGLDRRTSHISGGQQLSLQKGTGSNGHPERRQQGHQEQHHRHGCCCFPDSGGWNTPTQHFIPRVKGYQANGSVSLNSLHQTWQDAPLSKANLSLSSTLRAKFQDGTTCLTGTDADFAES